MKRLQYLSGRCLACGERGYLLRLVVQDWCFDISFSNFGVAEAIAGLNL